ncbi:MAG: hypothetical protein D6766_04700 [Verrucomicrobia bacterium]|nr:MAG: hypothetical protein D6766_04700 [Verrucomicrobiota bacterium]
MKRSVCSRWLAVTLYALAMAWVEAAVVCYLRTIIGEFDPARPAPTPLPGNLIGAEMIREVATLIMLGTVAWLAGEGRRSRVGAFLLAFGVWDIGYYVFLVPLTGWPHGLADWDILFLLPLPWWGPVWAPVSIALLMILAGSGWLVRGEEGTQPLSWKAIGAGTIGALGAMAIFMLDALRQLGEERPLRLDQPPADFPELLFGVTWMLMAIPALAVWRRPAPHRTGR